MNHRLIIRALATPIAGCLFAAANAQWTVTDLHPNGADASSANIAAGQAYYGGIFTGGSWQAVRLGQGPLVNFNPAGASASGVSADDGAHQYGTATFGSDHAGRWSGSAASFEDWNPSGAASSTIYNAQSGVAGGFATFGTTQRATIWNGGGANDTTDLHNGQWLNSSVDAIDGGRQYGDAEVNAGTYHAIVWYGAASSYDDLNPLGAESSQIIDATGGVQCGFADYGLGAQATVWKGTIDSALDLHPFWYDQSVAFGTDGQYVAETLWTGGVSHAGLWDLTTMTFIDLQPLSAGYDASAAYDVQVFGGQVQVFGTGHAVGGTDHAVMWTMAVPEPASLAVLAGALAVWVRRRKSR